MIRCGTATLVLCMATAVSIASWAAEAPPAAGLALNEDNSHFFGSRKAEDMTPEGLNAFVDQYAGTRVTHLFLCPNAMRASYDSAVWDAIWEVGNQRIPEDIPFAKLWVDNARLLHERGLDPYAVWIARCRQKGISPWLSMRMNDLHDVDDPTNFMHSTFWLSHPEYRRVPEKPAGWIDRALDFGRPEVREHNLRLIDELLERYDTDGIELDWMRFGYHFKPGEEEQGRVVLTEFMRTVRTRANEWAQRRGHPVRVGARVPTHPDAAAGLGMDGVTWAREGLVDMLVPTPFWATSDFDIPVELWKERLGPADAKVVVAAGLEISIRAHPGEKNVPHDLESVRGFAASAWNRGAEQIYLFNFMDPAPMEGGAEAYRALLEQGLDPADVAGQPRRHVVTYRDTVPSGFPSGIVLPALVSASPAFRLHIGPAPATGEAVLIIGLADKVEAGLKATANGTECTALSDHAQPERFPGVKQGVRFACPLEALRDGYNDFQVVPVNGTGEGQIVWVELRIDPSAGAG